MNIEDRFVYADCDCVKGESFVLGGKPEYTSRADIALNWFEYHQQNDSLYFSVHYKGKHIIHVK